MKASLSVFEPVPSSLSSYSTLKPERVDEADVQDTTKLFDVISVTDSEVSTSGGGWVVSPSDFSTRKRRGNVSSVSMPGGPEEGASAHLQDPSVVVNSKRVISRRP